MNTRELGINFCTVHLVYLPHIIYGCQVRFGGLLYYVSKIQLGNTFWLAYCIYLTLFNKQACKCSMGFNMCLAQPLISNSGLLNLKYHTIHLIAIGATNNVAEKSRFYFAFLQKKTLVVDNRYDTIHV